jgi:hypothetical protein
MTSLQMNVTECFDKFAQTLLLTVLPETPKTLELFQANTT